MLSVSLIITMVVFSSNAKESLVQEIQQLYGNMDLSVGYNLHEEKVIDQDFINEISSLTGVSEYSSVIISNQYIDQLGATVYTVGAENDSLVKSRYHFEEDIDNSEVILNQSLAESLNVSIGDTVSIEGRSFVVKEVISNLEEAGLTTDNIILSRNSLKEIIFDTRGVYNEATYLLIKAQPESDVYALANEIRQLDTDLRIDVAAEDEFLVSNLSMLNQFMIVLSILILIIASLFIISNFEMFLYKYRNQLAIMRSMGATKGQMFTIILFQSSLINICGSILGFLLALFSHEILKNRISVLFSYPINDLGFNYSLAVLYTLISMVVIQLFMIFPSYRGSKALPIKIIQENEKGNIKGVKQKTIIGYTLILFSVLLILIGYFNSIDISLLLGAFMLVASIFILFQVYLSKLLHLLLPVMKKVFGKTSFIAVKNLIPQVQKNTFVIVIISTLLMIVIFGSSLFSTIQINEQEYLKNQYPTNIVITSRANDNSTINSFEFRQIIEEYPSIEGVSTQSIANLGVINNSTYIDYALVDITQMQEQGLLPDISYTSPEQIIITNDFAARNNIEIGDKLSVSLIIDDVIDSDTAGTLTVSSIIEEFPNHLFGREGIIDWRSSAFKEEQISFERAFITTNDEQFAIQELENIKSIYPEVQVNSLEKSLEQANEMLLQRWAIFIVTIIIMLISVLLGVFNTLINNIHSKRKEFAILRTISLDKKGIVKVILTQVLLYVSLGIILGFANGTILTYTLGLIDSSSVLFNPHLVLLLIIIIIVLSFIVFIPFGGTIASRKITIELTQDNK